MTFPYCSLGAGKGLRDLVISLTEREKSGPTALKGHLHFAEILRYQGAICTFLVSVEKGRTCIGS